MCCRKHYNVVAAVIEVDGKVLCMQRGETRYSYTSHLWEFPGGKIEAGEKREQALKREIREELDAEIEVGELLRTIDYDYPNFHLTMHCFKCTLDSAITLKEHEAAKWLKPEELNTVQWLPADEEIIEELKQ